MFVSYVARLFKAIFTGINMCSATELILLGSRNLVCVGVVAGSPSIVQVC